MDRLNRNGLSLSTKDSDDDGSHTVLVSETDHSLLGQSGNSEEPNCAHDGEGDLFTAVTLHETAEHFMEKGIVTSNSSAVGVSMIPKLTDGQAVQLEDGSTAYILTSYKEGSTAIHLEDGTTAYISNEPPDGTMFGEGSALVSLDGGGPTSTTDGCIVGGRKMHVRAQAVVGVNGSSSDRPFKCDFDGCGKTFATGYGLKSHTRVHTGEKPYKCPHEECDKSFKTSGDLQKHVRTHTGERPFRCPFEGCGRSFTTSNIRKVHIRTHTGERPYICESEGCGKAFASATNYKNHIRIHSGEKPYVCTVEGCNKRFTEYSSLYKHHVVHTHSKPYTCNHCGKNYRQTSTLAMHKRTAHGEDLTTDDLGHHIQLLGGNVMPLDVQQHQAKRMRFTATGHPIISAQSSSAISEGHCVTTANSNSSLQGQSIAISSVSPGGQEHQIYIVTNPGYQVMQQLSQPHVSKIGTNDVNADDARHIQTTLHQTVTNFSAEERE